ncbi:MAG: hypothetical protein GYB33_13170 [Gammaproteobacteria bacterium]|nr:hypothetical protein [Gammaproteobacteria bacterium]
MKYCYRLCLLLMLGCASQHSGAQGLVSIEKRTAAATAAPLITDRAGNTLGLYGGMTSIRTLTGYEPGLLLILDGGDMLGATLSGHIALLERLYFTETDCRGRRFFPPQLTGATLTYPFPGSIGQSPHSGELLQIEKYSAMQTVSLKSMFSLSNNSADCINTELKLKAWPLLPVTQQQAKQAAHIDGSPIGVMAELPAKKREQRRAKKQQQAPQDMRTTVDQAECSPACLVKDLGNGVCDVDCYLATCNYDDGDCDSLDQEVILELQQSRCAPGCELVEIGDSFCDTACNNSQCSFDGGDCSDLD